MKRITKIVSYFTVALVFMVGLSGCTKTSSTTDPNAKKVIVWGFEDSDAWKEIGTDFTSQNKGYSVTYIHQTFDSNYENRVLNSILSGAGPDVWEMPNDWVYRHQGKLLPAPQSVSQQINFDSYLPIIKQSVLINNQIYGLAPSVEPLVVLYNQTLLNNKADEINSSSLDDNTKNQDLTLLQSIPLTWDKFTELAKLLTKKNNAGIDTSGLALGTDKISNAQDILYLLMFQNGTNIVSDKLDLATFNLAKETPKVTTDFPGRQALNFYSSFANPQSSNYTWSDSLGNNVDAFANGKVAMIFGYADTENYLKQKYPQFSYSKGAIPQLYSDDPSKITDFARFYAYGVSNQTTKANLSWSLVQLIASDNAGSVINSSMGYSPNTIIKDEKPVLAERNTNKPEHVSLLNAKTLIKGRYPSDFDNAILNAISEVNRGVQDSGSALNAAANTMTQLLNKQTW